MLVDYKIVMRMRKLTSQFISMTDCYHALALSNSSIYDAILLLHKKKIKSFTDVLKLNCCYPRTYRGDCKIGTTKFLYKKVAEGWDLFPICDGCSGDLDPNLMASVEQFKRILNGEDFNKVCPEITAYQIIES